MVNQTVSVRRQIRGSWLAAYRDYIVKQESPDIFHFWVGCQQISAALKRNVWVDRGAYRVFPNQYVFLVSRSGHGKKSASMDFGMDLVRRVEGIRVLYGRMTVEGIIDYMDHASIGPDGRVRPDGSVFIQADELSYIFGKAAYTHDLIDFFTAAYTSRARLDFLTRNKGLCTVRNPCPSILSATTPEQLGDIFPSLTLVSGFMARTILVFGDRKERVAKPILDRSLEEMLINDLLYISQLMGDVKLTDEADEYFDRWYEVMGEPTTPELASYWERRHDHILKMALTLSISESDDKVITLSHIERAIAALSLVETSYARAIAFVGASSQSLVADHIEAIIRTTYPSPISHSVLLRRVYRRLTYGSEEFRSYLEDLKAQGRIHEIVDPKKGLFYSLKRIPK